MLYRSPGVLAVVAGSSLIATVTTATDRPIDGDTDDPAGGAPAGRP